MRKVKCEGKKVEKNNDGIYLGLSHQSMAFTDMRKTTQAGWDVDVVGELEVEINLDIKWKCNANVDSEIYESLFLRRGQSVDIYYGWKFDVP